MKYATALLLALMLSTTIATAQFWTLSRARDGRPVSFLAVNDSGTVFAGIDTVGLARSSDQGLTWEFVGGGVVDRHLRSIAINTRGTVVVGTDRGKGYRSTDNGGSWLQITGFPAYNCLVLLAGPANEFYATNDRSVYRSTDDGLTWMWLDGGRVDAGVLRSGTIDENGLAMFAGDGKVAWQYWEGTWGNIAIIPSEVADWRIWSLVYSRFGFYYAASDYGILQFPEFPYGRPTRRQLQDLEHIRSIVEDAHGRLLAAGRGFQGVFESRDGGESWSLLNDGMFDKDVTCMVVSRSGELYAGMSSGAIYRSRTTTLEPMSAVLREPQINAINQSKKVAFRWHRPVGALQYELELSRSARFETSVTQVFSGLVDTTFSTEVDTLSEYYWRVRSQFDTSSTLSATRRFYTGLLHPPVLASPLDGSMNVERDLKLHWFPHPSAEQYLVAVYETANGVLWHSENTPDTTMAIPVLRAGIAYHWTVESQHPSTGERSDPSSPYSFVVAPTTLVRHDVSNRSLNAGVVDVFPNPFNSSARLQLTLERPSHVYLAIYDLLGRRIRDIASRDMPEGQSYFPIDLGDRNSGLYFVVTRVGETRHITKIVLSK